MNSSDSQDDQQENEELIDIDDQKVLEDDDDDERSMYEGKNIHTSATDGKLLCSYSQKLCKQRRLNGFAFCIRHVLEDKSCPFKRCSYMAKYNGQQCTNPIPKNEDRIYCSSHLQVLGMKPKKSRKRKGDDLQSMSESESLSSIEVEPKQKSKGKLKKLIEADTKVEKQRKNHRSPQRRHRKGAKDSKHVKGLKVPMKKKMKGLAKSASKETKKRLKSKSEKKGLERRPVKQEITKKKKIKAKKRIPLSVKYPSIKAIRDMRQNRRNFMRDILLPVDNEYFSSSNTEETDPGEAEYNRYWQTVFLDSYLDIDSSSVDSSQLDYADVRTKRIANLRDKLQKEVYQVGRFTIENMRQAKVLDRYLKFILKSSKQSPHLAARILCETGSSKKSFRKRQSVIIPCCYVDDEDVRCSKNALPYSRYCDLHILYDEKQVLYGSCTAKFSGGVSCARTTLDFFNEKPLCEEHARKKSLNNLSRSNVNHCDETRGVKRKIKVKERPKKSLKTSDKTTKNSAKHSSDRESPYMLGRLSDSSSDLISQRTPTPHSFNRLSPVLPEFLSNVPGEFHSLDTDILFDIANDIASGKNGEIDCVTPEEVAAVLAEVGMEGNNSGIGRILPNDVGTASESEDSVSEGVMNSVGVASHISETPALHDGHYNMSRPPRNLSPDVSSSSVLKLGATDPLMSVTVQPQHRIWPNTLPDNRRPNVSSNFIRNSSVSPRSNVVQGTLNQTFSFDNSVIRQSQNLNDNENASVCDMAPSAFVSPHQMFKPSSYISDNYSKSTLNSKHPQLSSNSPGVKSNNKS